MNYRHHFHAGNFADVMKHVLLIQLVRAMQRKDKGCLFLDTHAGRGSYGLDESPEHAGGIGRLEGRSDWPGAVRDYMELAWKDPYPGSPAIFLVLARSQDRMAFCEWHPGEFAELKALFSGKPRVSVHHMDGYKAIESMLPPPEKRALVLIDPPFEAKDEWSRINAAVNEAARRFPNGVYAVWYPMTARGGRPGGALDGLMGPSGPLEIASFELTVGPSDETDPGMAGCGLAVVNPPWRFEAEVRPVLAYLSGVFEKRPSEKSSGPDTGGFT